MLQFLIVLAILAAVVVVVGTPIRRAWIARGESPAAPGAPEVAQSVQSAGPPGEVGDLEAARDAKYREIRDAELDHRTGKLSDDDFEAVDRGLRAEAIQILNQLDLARGKDGEARSPGPVES
jgi:hypothetical protein